MLSMKTNVLLILLIAASFSACKKTVVKSDPEYPDLPAYSEKGLNVGGILINDKAWLTEKPGLFSYLRPLQLFSYPNGDSIVVLLNGHFKDNNINQYPRTLFVVIKNIRIVTDNDLLQLNDKSYTLDGNTNYGGFSEDYGNDKVGKAVGTITFGKVSEINVVYGDGSPNNPIKHPYIVAGYLDMSLSTTANYVLTNGRFDATIVRGTGQFIVY